MKKYLFFMLAILLLTLNSFAFNPFSMSGSVGNLCALYDGFVTGGNQARNIGRADTGEAIGGTRITPDSDIDVCRVDFYVPSVVGTLSGNRDIYCEIWTLSGTDFDTRLSVSNEIDGGDISAAAFNTATFASAVSLTGGNHYGLAVKTVADGFGNGVGSSVDASNYLRLQVFNDNNAGDMDGGLIATDGYYKWSTAGVESSVETADDWIVKVYTQ